MTPQEAAEEAFENYWESLGFGLRDNITDEEIMPFIEAFISGTKWQSEQDNQALSSALKEIAELHAKLHEMSEYITKVQSNNDDLEFANSELHAKVKDLQEALNSVCTKVERSTTLMIYTEPDVEAEINKARKLLSI